MYLIIIMLAAIQKLWAMGMHMCGGGGGNWFCKRHKNADFVA
jgi:hypothetical protein